MDSDTININVTRVTGLDRNTPDLEYRLYPNPSRRDVYLHLNNIRSVPEFIIDIYSVNGTLLNRQYVQALNTMDYKLEFNPLPGVYYIILNYDGKIIRDKLVIR
jgi:hypothetical protein